MEPLDGIPDAKAWPAVLTQEVADKICERSANGEGVLAIIADMGLPAETMDWLKTNHRNAIEAAKREQIKNKDKGAKC